MADDLERPSDLLDRVDFCVTKANCSGKSFIREGTTGRDTWVCDRCGAFTALDKGAQPIRPVRYPGGSRM